MARIVVYSMAHRGDVFPFVPIGGVIVCGIMVYPLLTELWLRVVGWLAIGLVIYVVYGMHHAKKPTWTLDDAPTK